MWIRTLVEGATPSLLHYTSTQAAAQILKTNRFELTSAVGTDTERQLVQKRRVYYLSTTRSTQGAYHRDNPRGVLLRLDGSWFNRHGYVTQSRDYWGPQFRAVNPLGNEMEDRVYSHEPSIPADAITEVHVLWERNDKWASDERKVQDQESIRAVLLAAKLRGLPAFLYDNRKAWQLLDTRRALSIPDVVGDLTGHTKGIDKPNQYRQWPSDDYMARRARQGKADPDSYKNSRLASWIELFHAKDKDQLSPAARKIAYDIAYGRYMRDRLESLKADLHNAKAPQSRDHEVLIKLVKLMQQSRLIDPKAFLDAMQAKWEKLFPQS